MSTAVDTSQKVTPMMQQWHRLKQTAKGAILLFRMGDFYEAFYEDAELMARELDLTLTKRHNIPMSGVPWHTCDAYTDRLVSRGYRVAIAEQVEDPKTAKGLVRREIVRFVTPGTVVNSDLVTEKANNFIISVTRVGAIFGLAALDLTTGSFQVMEEEDTKELLNEIDRLRPAELVSSKKYLEKN